MKIPYFADERKYFLNTTDPVTEFFEDKEEKQFIHVTGSTFGIEIRPDKKWNKRCEALYRKWKANAVRLENMGSAPDGSLAFVNDLPTCQRLEIDHDTAVDLSPLVGNRQIEDLRIGPFSRGTKFDFSQLPNLRRCQIPARLEYESLFTCSKLVCLFLCGGAHEGVLDLEGLTSLEEFIGKQVGKLKGVTFNSEVRLRSLELTGMKTFESAGPLPALTEKLLVVEFGGVPKLNIQWLASAKNVECIALRLGEIPSIKFLHGLKKLQVLDLFGSKVKDKDLSFRDSLKGELDPRLWGTGKILENHTR